MHAACGFEHLSIYSFSPALAPHNHAFESLSAQQVTIDANQLYLGAGFHRLDPARARIGTLRSEDEAPVIFVLRAEEIADDAYRNQIYERFGLAGRVSLLGQYQGAWLAINFYKHRDSGGVSEADILTVTARAPLINAAYRRNLAWQLEQRAMVFPQPPPLEFLRRILAQVAPMLSLRERDVCALALHGLTGEAIALELGIAETTVATLRRRAYAKMGITALNELFAICLRAAAAQPTRRSS